MLTSFVQDVSLDARLEDRLQGTLERSLARTVRRELSALMEKTGPGSRKGMRK